MSKQSCAICCSIFSFFGFIFLIFIGIIFRMQPIFIPNLHDPYKASNSCFKSAILYCLIMSFSGVIWYSETKKLRGFSKYNFFDLKGVVNERTPLLDRNELDENEPFIKARKAL